jgi:hypothetical protein
MASPRIEVEETNLEDLIILGEDKHIPISIEFPNGENTIKAKALIKQLTLKEMDKIKLNKDNPWIMNMGILKVALLKTNGDNFTEAELSALPMGVVTAISTEIMKASGVNTDNQLSNF